MCLVNYELERIWKETVVALELLFASRSHEQNAVGGPHANISTFAVRPAIDFMKHEMKDKELVK